MTTLTVRADQYKLKYNENTNQLKDLTWEELKIAYGKGSKIECPCMNREYNVAQSFIAAHMKSQKHRNWLEKEQKQYNKEYGHCGTSEDIINTLYKQLRENKVMYHNLNKSKKVCDEKLEKTEHELKQSQKVIESLKYNNETYKQLKENLKSKNTENETLLLEIKSLDEYIQKINLLLEIKCLENDIKTTKSNIIIKKKKNKNLINITSSI
jgi:hypothetical protein